MSQITLPHTIQSGDSDNPTRDMANWNAIVDVINGGLDNNNIATGAAIAISKTTLGTYTAPTTFTPSYAADGGGSYSTVTTQRNAITQIGKMVFFELRATGTIAGTVTTIRFDGPTPEPVSALEESPVAVAVVKNGAPYVIAQCFWVDSTSSWNISLSPIASYTAGTVVISVQGSYLTT